MKLNQPLKRIGWSLAGLLASSMLWAGCGSGSTADPALAAQNAEIQKLRAENQQLPEVQAQNEEVRRLQKENQSLPKVRNDYQQATRLKKENAQLREQIAKISPAAAAALTNLTTSANPVDQATAATLADGSQKDKAVEEGERENALNEGDEILVDPKALKAIIPEIDWEKMDRKDPVAIRSLLEKDGFQLTNVQQIKDLGLTNFIVQRKPQLPPPQPAPAAPAK